MMSFSELWKYFRRLGDPDSLSKEDLAFLERFLAEQYQLREKKRIQYLMRASGIKRVKLLNDFDWHFNPKVAKAKNLYSLIDFYAKVPILCLDELGYVLPSKEQADALFQIISKRTEVATTLETTNLVPDRK